MLVSILIPCYNAQRWIAQAIESALCQTWSEKEVIVIDDGSTDESLDVIRRYDGRIRWETGPNQGGNVTRNRLLERARGSWLQYLDADDYLLPDKISRQMQLVQAQPQAEIVFAPWIMEHWSERKSTRVLLEIREPRDPWILLARWFLPQTGGSLWLREAVVGVGGWNPEQPCCQEYELYLRLLIAGKRFVYCPEAGAIYRQWGDHTVCKRDMPETIRRRLEIIERAEEYLRNQGDLAPERLRAISQGRFESARLAWLYDPKFATEIVAVIRRSEPGFVPEGLAAPLHYQLMYRLFGFEAAEGAATVKRKIASFVQGMSTQGGP
jgi:glycosyltransferase involved in cell wall biosynthesis